MTYRREGWKTTTSNHSVLCERRSDVDRAIRRLHAKTATTSELSLLEVHRRRVSAWEPVTVIEGDHGR